LQFHKAVCLPGQLFKRSMAEHPDTRLAQLRTEARETVQLAKFPELAKSVGMSPDRFNRFLGHPAEPPLVGGDFRCG